MKRRIVLWPLAVLLVGLLAVACSTWASEPSTKPSTVDNETYHAAMERLRERSATTEVRSAERLERENRELQRTIAALRAQVAELTAKIEKLSPPTEGPRKLTKGITFAQVSALMGVQPSNVLRENGVIKAASWRFEDDITITPIGRFNKEDRKSFVFHFDDNGKLVSWQEFGATYGR